MDLFKVHSEVAWREPDKRLRVGRVLSTTNKGYVEVETDSDDVIIKLDHELMALTEAHKEEFLKARRPPVVEEAKPATGDQAARASRATTGIARPGVYE